MKHFVCFNKIMFSLKYFETLINKGKNKEM